MKTRKVSGRAKIGIFLVLLAFILVTISPSVYAETGAAGAGGAAPVRTAAAGPAATGGAGTGGAAGLSTLALFGIVAGSVAVLAITASAISDGEGPPTVTPTAHH